MLAEMGYVFILFIRYRIAEFLCSVGWKVDNKRLTRYE
jgi:hypothetical protein